MLKELGEKIDNWFVDGWKTCLHWYSTWGLAALAIVPVAHDNIALLKTALPESAYHYLMTGLAVLTFLARLIQQPSKSDTQT